MSIVRRRLSRASSSLSDFDGEEHGNDGNDARPSSSVTTAPSPEEDENVKRKPQETQPVTTLRKVGIRAATAFTLIGLYLLMLQAGHFYCILVAVFTQTELYRELVNIRYVEAQEREMPWFRTLQWSWFIVPMLLVYGETLHRFCRDNAQLQSLSMFTKNIVDSVFILYCVLFMASVLTLKENLLRFQLSQYMWSIVTVCFVVFQCKFFAMNALNGLFWYFFPMATVVMNDVSAYFCGITFGRRFIQAPFFTISPNKTWEGFIGAGVLTLVFSFFFPALLAQWTWLTCPAEGLYIWPFPPPLTCEPHRVFVPTPVALPLLGTVTLYPIQWHGLCYGAFASLVAPFGGFFASAIKRAYKKKDFQSFLPGALGTGRRPGRGGVTALPNFLAPHRACAMFSFAVLPHTPHPTPHTPHPTHPTPHAPPFLAR